ncbi:(2Fe-2S) ferredoxin domain-containing protein [Stenomitos frigidus]|uniref:Ferredoxin n=1 Tax=Stenomitos frigidus ULC18 TaxID=2107698 RepID=A0A2T1DW43_9CYAN|nr:(2Fe-2S) ferredoxin domain-containing protein [Stenomitos frigidus]PSB24661.1 ferredoxin [Stenomitos frigidus ULC18]
MSSPLAEPMGAQKRVLVCQHRTCLNQGAAAVLETFQAHPVAGWVITRSGCMGQCGNGPMVRMLPDNIWYCRVSPKEVAEVVERHLQGGRPVRAMLSPHFHADRSQPL